MNIYCFLISDITHGIFKNRWPACFTRCQSDSKSLIADRWDRISLQRTGVWSVAKSGKLWVFSRWRRAHTSLTAPHFISGTNILTVGLVRSEPKKRFAFAFNSSGIKSGGACSSSATASVIDSSWFVHVFQVHLFYIRKLSARHCTWCKTINFFKSMPVFYTNMPPLPEMFETSYACKRYTYSKNHYSLWVFILWVYYLTLWLRRYQQIASVKCAIS